jgi:uncharacterized protein YijF (DUF1287 family)
VVRALALAVLLGSTWSGPVSPGAAGPEVALQVHDIGIFPDLDRAVHVTLPPRVDGRRARLRLDERHRLLVLFEGDFPLKAYALRGRPPAGASPLGTPAPRALLGELAPADAAELAGLVSDATTIERAAASAGATPGDQDDDGIPDQLDVLMGARKLVLNHATYTEGYFRLPFPGGDVPRTVGVCSDTIVRAFRNAGIDLQSRVAADIRAAPASYRGVTHPNPSIDHRRVKTLLTWFQRHVPEIHGQPPRPGDVVFLDTFPSRPGPDHVGIISDRIAPSGLPFVINNWTIGYREGEMDLLPSVPVTHLFRMR